MTAKKKAYMVRKPYHRTRCQSIQGGESMTDRSQAQASDVNFIVKQYARTGTLPPPRMQPQYADVTGLQGDLTDRLNWANEQVEAARAHLAEMKTKRDEAERELINQVPELKKEEPEEAEKA